MSFNTNHITLDNYEEYFILYMDNELNAAEKQMVENFLSAHPQLQSEMNLLLSTQLPHENISFSGKEELLSTNIKKEAMDETLLLYIDNELPAAQKNKLEQQLSIDKDFQSHHQILLKTKLDGADVIPYPNKKELYRHTHKVVSIKVWMRIAAAVLIILFASLFFILNSETSSTPQVVGKKEELKKQPVQQKDLNNSIIPEYNNANAIAREIIKEETPEKPPRVSPQKDNRELELSIAQNEVPANSKKEIILDPITTQPTDNIIAFNTPENGSINKLPVTNETTGTYQQTEVPAESIVPDGDESNTKKGSFKGFLRKATRLIQRNTGIGTANDDNELLIAAIAVKLK